MSTFEFPTPDLLAQAREVVVHTQLGSAAMVQRKFKLSFIQSERIMEVLEEEGIVGPKPPSGGARTVLAPIPTTTTSKEDTPMNTPTIQCETLKLGDGTRCTKPGLYTRSSYSVCATHARVIDEGKKEIIFVADIEDRPATQAWINKEATPAPTVPKEDTPMHTPTTPIQGDVEDTTVKGRLAELKRKFGEDSKAAKNFQAYVDRRAAQKAAEAKENRPAKQFTTHAPVKVYADSDTVKVTCTGIVSSDEKGRPVIHGLVQAPLADVKGVRKFVCEDCLMNQDAEAQSEINAEMAVERHLESRPVEDDPNEGIQFIDEL